MLSIYYLSRKNLDLRQVWLLSFSTAIIVPSIVLQVAHELPLRLLRVSTEKEDVCGGSEPVFSGKEDRDSESMNA